MTNTQIIQQLFSNFSRQKTDYFTSLLTTESFLTADVHRNCQFSIYQSKYPDKINHPIVLGIF